jgi:hypothetical protein
MTKGVVKAGYTPPKRDELFYLEGGSCALWSFAA